MNFELTTKQQKVYDLVGALAREKFSARAAKVVFVVSSTAQSKIIGLGR